MAGYQAGIQKFEATETQILGISTDNTPSLGVFAKQQNLTYPLVSDFMRKTASDYGVLIADRGVANRTTFVIDKEGKITYIEEGNSAVNPEGAATACSRLKQQAAGSAGLVIPSAARDLLLQRYRNLAVQTFPVISPRPYISVSRATAIWAKPLG